MPLPLFPLHLVLFPGRPLPLHLFEPRYRLMLHDCLDSDGRFGVVAIRAGREVGGAADFHEVGTVAQIESVTELPDGRFDILTRGTRRFRVLELLAGKPYLQASVDLLDERAPQAADRGQAARLRALLLPYLSLLGAPDEMLERVPQEPDDLAYLAAAAVQVELRDQQRLLELESCTTRLDATLTLLRRELNLLRHFGIVGSLRPMGAGGAELN